MNKHQREGLAAVWGFYRIMLMLVAVFAAIGGIVSVIYWIWGSFMWATIIGICIMIGGIYGYITVDTYRTAVRRSQSEERYEIDRQAKRRQLEEEAEQQRDKLERARKLLDDPKHWRQ